MEWFFCLCFLFNELFTFFSDNFSLISFVSNFESLLIFFFRKSPHDVMAKNLNVQLFAHTWG